MALRGPTSTRRGYNKGAPYPPVAPVAPPPPPAPVVEKKKTTSTKKKSTK